MQCGLTTLRISNSAVIRPAKPLEILEALLRLPLLEVLELRNNGPFQRPWTGSTFNRCMADSIDLPCLKELILHDSLALAVHFLNGQVSLPPTAKVTIRIEAQPGISLFPSSNPWLALRTFIQDQSRYPAACIATVRLTLGIPDNTLRLSPYASDLASPMLTLNVSGYNVSPEELLGFVGASAFAGGVRQLQVDGFGGSFEPNLLGVAQALISFTGTQKLVLEDLICHEMVRCIADHSLRGVLPSLKNLILRNLPRRRSLGQSEGRSLTLSDVLEKFLEDRHDMGAGLKRVRMVSCVDTIKEDAAERLRQHMIVDYKTKTWARAPRLDLNWAPIMEEVSEEEE